MAYFRFDTEAVVQRCSVKKVFLEIPQNSQENTCVFIEKETLAMVFSCEFHEISKNPFLHRTSLVAASVWQLFYVYCKGKTLFLFNL